MLYLRANIPCHCLDDDADAAKAQPQTGKCLGCQRQVPKSQLKKCTGCGVAEYCGRECQREDWKAHKTTCGRVA